MQNEVDGSDRAVIAKVWENYYEAINPLNRSKKRIRSVWLKEVLKSLYEHFTRPFWKVLRYVYTFFSLWGIYDIQEVKVNKKVLKVN